MHFKPDFFQDRHAYLLCRTGVDGGFIDHHIARFEQVTRGFAGFHERDEIWTVGFIDWRRSIDDECLSIFQLLSIGSKTQIFGLF